MLPFIFSLVSFSSGISQAFHPSRFVIIRIDKLTFYPSNFLRIGGLVMKACFQSTLKVFSSSMSKISQFRDEEALVSISV